MTKEEKKIQLLLSVGFTDMGEGLFGKGGVMEDISSKEPFSKFEERIKSKYQTEDVKSEAVDEPVKEEQSVLKIESTEYEWGENEDGSKRIIKQIIKWSDGSISEKYSLDDLPFDVSIESDQEVYLCDELKKIPTPLLYRATCNGNRYYWEREEFGITLYASCTTIIKDGLVDRFDILGKWKNEQILLGKDPDMYASNRAAYGTCFHYLAGIFLLGQEIKPQHTELIKLLKAGNLRIDKDDFEYVLNPVRLDELFEDMIKFAQFCSDYKLIPYAIEKILRSKKYNVASPLDLLCSMEIPTKGFWGEIYKSGDKKGQPKVTEIPVRCVCVVDFKTGKNFYEEHQMQLGVYKSLVEENYGEVIDVNKMRLFNFSPKGSPYKLKEQTDSIDYEKLEVVLKQGFINHKGKKTLTRGFRGSLKYSTEAFNMNDYIVYEPIESVLEKTIP